jgi:predicted TIM-barrel fold metal-dependent hydrolase
MRLDPVVVTWLSKILRISVPKPRSKQSYRNLFAVNLEKPVEAVRELERAVRDLGFKALRVVPWLWNRPPKDKLYFPLYVKCIELDIPFCTQVGHTGPLCWLLGISVLR